MRCLFCEKYEPSDFEPNSHWGPFCLIDTCEHIVNGETLEDAILERNQNLEPDQS